MIKRCLTKSSNTLCTFTLAPQINNPNKSKSLLNFALINKSNQLATY